MGRPTAVWTPTPEDPRRHALTADQPPAQLPDALLAGFLPLKFTPKVSQPAGGTPHPPITPTGTRWPGARSRAPTGTPGFPVMPGTPCTPWKPAGPGGPGTPSTPLVPLGPWMPFGPSSPRLPDWGETAGRGGWEAGRALQLPRPPATPPPTPRLAGAPGGPSSPRAPLGFVLGPLPPLTSPLGPTGPLGPCKRELCVSATHVSGGRSDRDQVRPLRPAPFLNVFALKASQLRGDLFPLVLVTRDIEGSVPQAPFCRCVLGPPTARDRLTRVCGRLGDGLDTTLCSGHAAMRPDEPG